MQWRLLAIALCACALVNCGGGGGGGGGSAPSGNPSPRAPVTISGTVAAGAPLAGMTVDVGHNIGSVTSTTTDAQGRYRVTLPDFALPPFIVTAYSLDPAGDLKVIGPEATYRRMHSISISGGTVNVTPFTTLQTVRLFGRKPLHLGDWTFLSELPPITEQRIATARDEVVAYLLTRPDKQDGNATSPVDVSGVANFISTPFTPEPGDPYDDALERFRDSLTPRETILGIEEHMLHAGDAAADLAGLFSLEFEANCFASPESAQAVMPHGRVPIRFGPSGITIGSYHHAIEPGDRLVLTTGWGGADDRWDFDLAITTAPNGVPVWREGIFVTQERGNIETISLGISGVGASNCSTLFLAKAGVDRKHPSIFSQIGLLANSLKDRAFVCPALPEFPGVPAGTNVLLFDRNGAVRVNDRATGHVVHLPSLGFTLIAELFQGPTGPSGRLRGLYASRTGNLFDEDLAVLVTADGRIEGVRFSMNHNNVLNGGFILSKTCGVNP